MPFAGEIACLTAALLWAVAVALFRSPVLRHGARSVSLVKCGLGAALQGLTVLVTGQAGVLFTAPGGALLLLSASGVIGLAIGDTALLATVARLGVHRTMLLQTTAPVFTALIAWIWQDELPTTMSMIGAVVILAGVALVVAPTGKSDAVTETTKPWFLAIGLALGLLAALGQGAGVVLAKVGMEQVPVVPASFLRLATAAIGLGLLLTTRRRVAGIGKLVRAPEMLSRVVPATLLGTYVALFLMMLGVTLAPAAIAATLLSVSPVYGLFIDTFVYRQPIRARGLAGTLLAVVGVAILTGG